MVQALIMAGGEGVRLRPLTLSLPKPLVPLLGEPVMGYALQLLKKHGITDVGATLCYQPRKIREAFGKGNGYGVNLKFFEETAPRGTAGSVKMAEKQLRDTFFVLSGDGLTDCDLTDAIRYHREKKALATLVLKRVPVPLAYGVVMTDGNGRITRFLEKPGWQQVFSDLVNTGIYILEPEILKFIPAGGISDFGKDLFPALLAENLPLYGYEMEGYWCDVGSQQAYLEAQMALLRGEVQLPFPSGIHESARMEEGARIEGPCLIGRGSRIGAGAVLQNAVIGENCVVGKGARLENACLWNRAAAMDHALLSGCVLCEGAIARQGAEIGEGCALGQGAIAGSYAKLRPGSRIWPHLKAASGAVLTGDLIRAASSASMWTEKGADYDSPERACALCRAYVKVTGCRQIMAACDEENAALAIGAGALAIGAGALASAGAWVLTAGKMKEPMLRSVMTALHLDGGVYFQGQTLRFLGADGRPLTARQRSALDSCLLRQDAPPAFTRPGSLIAFTGAEEIYWAKMLPEGVMRPLWSPIGVCSQSPELLQLARTGLERLGAKDARFELGERMQLRSNETGFFLSENGEEIRIRTGDKPLTPEEKTLLLLSLCKLRQGALYDGPGIPRAAAQLSPLLKENDSPACLFQQQMLKDGLGALLLICQAMKEGPLSELIGILPETHILTREIDCAPKDKGRVLHMLCERMKRPHTLGDGLRIDHEKGFATIVPDAYRGLVRITSEAGNSEFAAELCDFYQDEIRKLTGSSNPFPK